MSKNDAVSQANAYLNKVSRLEALETMNRILQSENDAYYGFLVTLKSALNFQELTAEERRYWIEAINWLLQDEDDEL